MGRPKAQKPTLAVALHADPLGQFPCFLGGIPEDEVFRFFRRGGYPAASIAWRGVRGGGRRIAAFPILLKLLEHAIKFGLSFGGFAAVEQGSDLLFHRLEDGRRIAPAGGPFSYALRHALDLFGKTFAVSLPALSAAPAGALGPIIFTMGTRGLIAAGQPTNGQRRERDAPWAGPGTPRPIVRQVRTVPRSIPSRCD